jgi:hypothetical protein
VSLWNESILWFLLLLWRERKEPYVTTKLPLSKIETWIWKIIILLLSRPIYKNFTWQISFAKEFSLTFVLYDWHKDSSKHLNILNKWLLPIALLFIKNTPKDFPVISSMHMKNVWWPYKLWLFYKANIWKLKSQVNLEVKYV